MVPPRFLRPHFQAKKIKNKVDVFVMDNPWCDGCDKTKVARKAVKGLEHLVNYHEATCPCRHRHLHLGSLGGIFIDGKPYKPYQVIGQPKELRRRIIATAKKHRGLRPD
jgi:hypothetical protein